MQDFTELNLPAELAAALEKINFKTPTPIQSKSIPFAMLGRDILGTAQTGTGKTGAFGIPLIAKLLTCPTSKALILTPTRELAQQIVANLHLFINGNSSIKTALLIGGEPIMKQFEQLKRSPRIIVGTPGRINDHLVRKTLKLDGTNFLVLDETDRMLDMGFEIQLESIFKLLPKERQTLMFSATIPNNIMKLSDKYLNNPERVFITSHATPPVNITQENINTTEVNKFDNMLDKIQDMKGSIIIFVKTKRGADNLAKKLAQENFSSASIHGDLRQNKRERIIIGFRKSKYQILVATDLAARGLDIPHIELVINYDLPQCPEDYIHRIGRTARAGAKGAAINFITSSDMRNWKAIERLISTNETTTQSERRGSSSGSRDNNRRRDSSGRDGGNSSRRSFDGAERGKPFGERRSFGGRGGDSKPFGGRDSKPFGERRSFGDRGDNKPFGDRDSKPFGERRSFGDRGDNKPFGDRDNKPFGERRSFGGRGGESKPFGDRDSKPFGSRDNKPFGERRSFGGRGDNKPFGERSRSENNGGFNRDDRGARPFVKKKSFDFPAKDNGSNPNNDNNTRGKFSFGKKERA